MDRAIFDRGLGFIEGYFGAEYTDKAKDALWRTTTVWTDEEFKACHIWMEKHFEARGRVLLPLARDWWKWFQARIRQTSGEDDALMTHGKAAALLKRVKAGDLSVSKQYHDFLRESADKKGADWFPPSGVSSMLMLLMTKAMLKYKSRPDLFKGWSDSLLRGWDASKTDKDLLEVLEVSEGMLDPPKEVSAAPVAVEGSNF